MSVGGDDVESASLGLLIVDAILFGVVLRLPFGFSVNVDSSSCN